MIIANGQQDASLCIRHTERSFDALQTMVPTAADVLRFLQHSSSAGLLLSPIIRFARHLPALSGNILEMHFGKRGNSVDFATRLHVEFDKPLIEDAKRKHYNLPFLNSDYTALINQQENKFNYGIENMWNEYDAPFRTTPALFFDINRSEAFCPQAAYGNLQKITGLFGHRVNTKLRKFLEQITAAGLYVVYYGFMFSRSATGMRLTINGIQAEQLIEALEQLGWKGNYEGVKKIRDTYLTTAQMLVVGVDFEDRFENRIGIEVFTDNNAAFIQTLYNNNQITQAHVDLLNTWEQCFALPENLSKTLTWLHRRQVKRLHTRLNHFKFVVDDSGVIAAKGYLYYCF